MTENSKIEWTHHTFNPWIGCTKVSPGCDHCYAEGVSARFKLAEWGTGKQRRLAHDDYWKQPLAWNRKAAARGERHRVFCASLADVFDNEVPEEWRVRLFALIEETPHLDWLLLTKRIGNARSMMPVTPLPNVWLGASIVNQAEADRDITKLLCTPARIHFLSMEPLLGPVSLREWLPHHHPDNRDRSHTAVRAVIRAAAEKFGSGVIDWVIVGGESGTGARPMHIDWARLLRNQCQAAGVAFFFKQWGAYKPCAPVYPEEDPVWQQCWIDDHHPGDKAEDWDLSTVDAFDFMKEFPDLGVLYRDGHFYSGEEWQPHVKSGCWWMERVGKKAAGRLLDGREWNAYPEAA